MPFSMLFRIARRAQRMTLDELAVQIGSKNPNDLAKIEYGTRPPPKEASFLRKLGEALDLPDDLLRRAAEMQKSDQRVPLLPFDLSQILRFISSFVKGQSKQQITRPAIWLFSTQSLPILSSNSETRDEIRAAWIRNVRAGARYIVVLPVQMHDNLLSPLGEQLRRIAHELSSSRSAEEMGTISVVSLHAHPTDRLKDLPENSGVGADHRIVRFAFVKSDSDHLKGIIDGVERYHQAFAAALLLKSVRRQSAGNAGFFEPSHRSTPAQGILSLHAVRDSPHAKARPAYFLFDDGSTEELESLTEGIAQLTFSNTTGKQK